MPLAPEKTEGPSSTITFLGITIDTVKGELRLPAEKLTRLIHTVSDWLARRSCTRRELESLIGVLQHACKVIRPGRSFQRRAIALLNVTKHPHHHIRLNKEFRSDLRWWSVFSSHWNGAALLVSPCSDPSTAIFVTSDASGSWGCGAWSGPAWFQLEWDQSTSPKQIATKELIPILIAAVVWGHTWTGVQVLSLCDNEAVVTVINSRSSREPDLMQLLRCLFFLEAHFQFYLIARHLPGVANSLADDLSRNRLPSFRRHHPNADPLPSPIPSSTMQWLLHPKLDWTSEAWIQLFTSSVKRE